MRCILVTALACIGLGTLAGPAAADYAAEVLADVPIGYWRLGEVSGSVAADLSGNENHGTYAGVVLGAEGTGCGSPELAATFDDADDRVTVTQAPSLYVPHVTMEAWVLWCGGNGTQQRIIERSWHGPSISEYGLSVLDSGLLRVEIQSTEAGGLAVTSLNTLPVSDWTHLAATYDGATIAIYIDGVLDVSEPAGGGVIDNDNKHLGIGNQASRDRPFNGSLDEVALYGYALAPARIQTHFATCTPPSVELCPLYPNRKIYWTDYGTDKIQRADPAGADVEDIVTSGLGFPFGIAIDESAGKVYWADGDTDKIQRANVNGTAVEDLITTGLIIPDAIALDVSAGKMYWSDRGTDKIQRANLDGTGVEDIVTAGLTSVSAIALDIPAGKLYWADGGTPDLVQRANLDGTMIETLVTGISNPTGLALDLDAGKMYWAETSTGTIQRANLDGTDEEDLVTGLGLPRHVVLAFGKLYWTDSGEGKLQRANLDGTGVVDLVTGLADPYGIVFGPGDDLATSDVFDPAAPSSEVRVLHNRPSPFASSTTIEYELARAEKVRLEVFDASGRQVRILRDGRSEPAGRHHVNWDGRDSRGRPVASGVYLYKITTESFGASGSTVRIR